MADKRPSVVIVGGNFAGLTAATRLPARKFAVTLVDQYPDFEWTPNIHELVSGVKAPEGLRLSRRKLMKKHEHAFCEGHVHDVSPGDRVVSVDGHGELPYDACLLAVGGAATHDRVPGAAGHAIPFSSAENCMEIARRLQALAEREHFSVAIIGAGVTGVEALGEVLRRYRSHPGLSVHVVEAAERMMPGSPPELDEDIRAQCADWDVHFHMGLRVDRVTAQSVRLSNDCLLPADLVVWCAGAGTPALLREAGLADESGHWAPVKITLQSAHDEHIFLAGDCTDVPAPARKQAYHAMEMGQLAATNIRRWLKGKRLKKFKPSKKPILVAFGDLETYLVAGPRVIAGRSLAAAKEGLFQGGMALFAPPLEADAVRAMYRRFDASLRKLVLPQFTSLESALALGHYRLIC